MSDKITAIKIKRPDGTYSNQIPISVLAENVKYDNTKNLVDQLNYLNDRISNIIAAPSGSTQLDQEVLDIKIGNDGVTYNTPGDAVRTNDQKALNSIDSLKNILFKKNEYIEVFDASFISPKTTNTAVTNNLDGSYTIETSDYGTIIFGTSKVISPGEYTLYGVSNGYSFISTSANYSTAIQTNSTTEDKKINIENQTTLYLGFRINKRPSSSFTITPYLSRKKTLADETDEINEEIKDFKDIDSLYVEGKNKLDINKLTPDMCAADTTGVPTPYSGWSLSDFIPITKEDKYYTVIQNDEGTGFKTITSSSLYVGYYSADKTPLRGMTGSPITYNNDNLAYIRVSIKTENFYKHAMVVDQKTYLSLSTLDDYEEYKKEIYPIVPEIELLKDYNESILKLSYGKNLIGNEPNFYYSVFIPAGTKISWAYEDRSALKSQDFYLYFYDENKQQIDWYAATGNNGQTSRTIMISNSKDTYYIVISKKPSKNLQVEKGSSITDYEPYIPNSKTLKQMIDNVKKGTSNEYDKEYAIKLSNAKRKANSSNYGKLTSPEIFTLAHFSDIHGNAWAMAQVQNFIDTFSNFLDDTICTGDLVIDKISDGLDFWNNNSNGDVLICIGNHDSHLNSNWSNIVDQTTLYNTFIAPYENNWNAQTVTNHTYWHKDYSEKKIRLICIDATIIDSTEQTAQMTWLNNVLNEAKENSYSVIGAIHFPPMPSKMHKIKSNFSALLHESATDMNKFAWSNNRASILGAVDQFITNGGDFICWISGHTHWDLLSYDNDFPKQLFITISCAMPAGAYEERIRSTQNRTGFILNTLCVDTVRKYIKILRYGADWDDCLRHAGTCIIKYDANPPEILYET